jgi:hypothetical protein
VLAGLGETGRHCGGFGVVVGSKSSLVESRSRAVVKLFYQIEIVEAPRLLEA